MRTRRLLQLTLVVLALHGLAAWLAAVGLPRFAVPAAGVRLAVILRIQPTLRASSPPHPATAVRPPGPSATTATARGVSAQAPPRPGAFPRASGPARAHAPPPARPGEGGAVPAVTPVAPAWPVYATQVPPSVRVRYRLVEGRPAVEGARDGGQAELEWHCQDGRYALRLATTAPGRPPREWLGDGTLDAAGVAPVRLVERDRGRDTRAINFDRDNARVRFSGASAALPVAPGAQDRWSWLAQLAAIAEAGSAAGHPIAPDTRWDLQVAGLRGELDRWSFRVLADAAPPPELQEQGNDVSAGPGRAPALLHVLRAPEHPYDLRIEAWLSPSLHHLPAGLRMSTPPGPWSLSLWQQPLPVEQAGPGS